MYGSPGQGACGLPDDSSVIDTLQLADAVAGYLGARIPSNLSVPS